MNEQLLKICSDSLSLHGKSFRWAGFFLGTQTYAKASVVYAYCRMLDDTADEDTIPKQVRLDQLESRRQEILTGRPVDPLGEIFLSVTEGCQHSKKATLDLIDGVIFDLDEPVLKSKEELEWYCYAVAGTVGVLMCKVLGVDLDNPTAKEAAVSLGKAMQITNILRDIREDFTVRGRIYLPNLGSTSSGPVFDRHFMAQVFEQKNQRSVEHLMVSIRLAFQLSMDLYQIGFSGLKYIPFRSRLAIWVAGVLYREIGVKVVRNVRSALDDRVFTSFSEKLWIVLKRSLARPRSNLLSRP